MKPFTRLISGMFLFLALSALALSDEQPSKEAFLEQWAAALERVTSLRCTRKFALSFASEDMLHRTEMISRFSLIRPYQVSLRFETTSIVCDGTNVFVRLGRQRKYCEFPQAGRTVAEVLSEIPSVSESSLPDTCALTSENALTALREVLASDLLEVQEVTTYRDRPCWLVRWQPSELSFLPMSKALKAWIDTEWGIIWAIQTMEEPALGGASEDQTASAEDADDAELWRQFTVSLETTEAVLNEPIPEDAFRFVPNPSDEKVESLFGITGHPPAAAGFERFRLSGKSAPDFSITLLDGSTFQLSDHTGSVVLIDFWATWCGPCMKALPHMRQIYERFHTNGLVIIGVSRDRSEDREKVQSALTNHSIQYRVGIDADGSIASAYDLEGIPCLVLINREGVVQGRKVGFSKTELSGITRDIEAVLQGKTIPGAQPLSDEELQEWETQRANERARRAGVLSLDTNWFRPVWQLTGSRSWDTMDLGDRVAVAIPPKLIVVTQPTQWLVVTVADGGVQLGIPRIQSESPAGSKVSDLNPVFLRTETNGVLVTARRILTQGAGGSYKPKELQLQAVAPSGETLWTQTLKQNWSFGAIHVLPISEAVDYLLVSTLDAFLIMTSNGQTLLQQPIDFRSFFVFFASETAPLYVLTTTEQSVALYEVTPPTP